jgi:hypothetical protein
VTSPRVIILGALSARAASAACGLVPACALAVVLYGCAAPWLNGPPWGVTSAIGGVWLARASRLRNRKWRSR